MKVRGPVALGFLAVLLLSSTAASQEVPPLVVSDVTASPDGQRWTFSVENKTDRTVTAWGVKLTQITEDGAETIDHVGIDGHAAFEGIIVESDQQSFAFLPPHRRSAAWGRREKAQEGRGARVTGEFEWVVFDDGTAIGDERYVAAVFRLRGEQARGWGRVAAALRAASDHSNVSDALADAARELSAKQARPDATDQIPLMVARNFEMGLAGRLPGGSSEAELNRLFRHWLNEAERRAAAAEKHRVRKRNPPD